MGFTHFREFSSSPRMGLARNMHCVFLAKSTGAIRSSPLGGWLNEPVTEPDWHVHRQMGPLMVFP